MLAARKMFGMPEIPKLTDTQIRRRVGDRSFERGQSYAADGTIFEGRRQGRTLKASCEGSQGGPYRVEVTFDGKDIVAADCDCPVGDGGCCKHVAALLLVWRKDPDSFIEVEEVESALSRRSKEELIAVIRQMLLEKSELESLLTIPLPGTSGAATPDVYGKQAGRIFHRADAYEWGVEAKMARELKAIRKIGDGFIEAGDLAGAAAVYIGLAEEVMEQHGSYQDENGDLSRVVIDCSEGLANCLDGLKQSAARESILRALLGIYEFDLELGGTGVGDEAFEALLEKTTPQERKEIAGWARDRQAGKSDWAKKALGGFLIDLEQDTLDDEAYLKVCRESGRRDDLIERLLKLGRVDEAARETEGASIFDLIQQADLFVAARHGDVGEGLVLARLRKVDAKSDSSEDWRGVATRERISLQEWLKSRAKKRGDKAEAIALAERIFFQQSSLEGYKELHQLIGSGANWEATRRRLLSHLSKDRDSYLLINIYLSEDLIDEALAVLARSPNLGWGSGMNMRVAKAAEKQRPQAAIDLYAKKVEQLIHNGGRGSYQEACGYLKDVRRLRHQTREDAEWKRYIANLREANPRLRALREELDKAGL